MVPIYYLFWLILTNVQSQFVTASANGSLSREMVKQIYCNRWPGLMKRLKATVKGLLCKHYPLSACKYII